MYVDADSKESRLKTGCVDTVILEYLFCSSLCAKTIKSPGLSAGIQKSDVRSQRKIISCLHPNKSWLLSMLGTFCHREVYLALTCSRNKEK